MLSSISSLNFSMSEPDLLWSWITAVHSGCLLSAVYTLGLLLPAITIFLCCCLLLSHRASVVLCKSTMHILPSLCLILIKNALCVFYVAYIYIPSLCYNNHGHHLLHVLYHKQWLVSCQMAHFSLGKGQDGTCPSSMFLCDTNRCLPTSWRCDWEIDCSDMSDELDCCKFWVRWFSEWGMLWIWNSH